MIDLAIQAFAMLVVAIDPFGVAPIFTALPPRTNMAARSRIAVRGVMLAAAILLVFALVGHPLLQILGVSLDAFRISGGVLLFLLSVDMLLARPSGLRSTTGEEQEEASHQEDITVFPLAIPLLAGPGAMTSIVLLMGGVQGDPVRSAVVLGVLAAVLALTLLTLIGTGAISRLLGVTGSNVISRVSGIVLAALAVQFVLDGLRGAGIAG